MSQTISPSRLQPLNCGRFISRGKGSHPVRVIDSHVILFLFSGHLEMFEEGKAFSLKAGDWLILRKGHRHGGLAPYSRGLSFFWMHFLCEEAELSLLPQTGHATRPERMATYCQALLSEQHEQERDEVSFRLLLELALHEALRFHVAPADHSLSPTPLAEAAEHLVRTRYADPITPGTISKELHCNPDYLGRIFSLHFGETLAAAINRHRVTNAARLLVSENLSIKEIMHRVGFQDPAYFRRKFRLHYGVTPGEYRRFLTTGHRNTEG